MTSAHKNRSLAKRMSFALTGLAHALRAERSLRTQLGILLVVAAALVTLRPPAVWWGR